MKRAPLSLAVSALAIALSACTSTQDVLEPAALTAVQPPATQPPGVQSSDPAAAALATPARVNVAPLIGATAEASTPLTVRLAARARERGIGIVPPGDASTTHVMRGYFSAISENGETTVIYVWDVMDPAGNRVHRIQGQQRAPAGRAEGWSSVQPATMEVIADQTLDQFTAWLSARPG